MKKSKVLKELKADVQKKFDELGIEVNNEEVEIICSDKECLLKSVLNKMDLIINGKSNINTARTLATNTAKSA